MDISLQQLRDKVARAGATLEVHDEHRRIEYEAGAPVGKHWEPDLRFLLSSCIKGPGSALAARQDLWERLDAYPLEACSEECGWCNVEEEDPC